MVSFNKNCNYFALYVDTVALTGAADWAIFGGYYSSLHGTVSISACSCALGTSWQHHPTGQAHPSLHCQGITADNPTGKDRGPSRSVSEANCIEVK